MKWLQVTCMAAMLSMAASAMAGEDETLSYRTFIDYAKQGKVQSVVISELATDNIKAAIRKDDAEVTYSIRKPYSAGEDALLLDFLNERNIPHEIKDNEVPAASSLWKAMIPALVMFALPGLFLLTTMIMAILILSKVSRVERMLESATSK